MANQTDIQIVEEGYRNATVRFTGYMDTSNVSLSPAVSLSQFVANDPNYTKLVGLRVDWMQYAIDTDIVIQLSWNSSSPQLIAVLSDTNDISFRSAGGLMPNRLLTGYDGAINLVTAGYTAGNSSGFTVAVQFVKLYQV